ncbi:MAG: hypothetical protein IJD74_08095 [Clostridia bacterium]|nr:hypothetical protein [Clostridia bacterium]
MDRKKIRLISLCVAIFGALLMCTAMIAYGFTFYRLVESMQTNGGGIIGGAGVPTMSFVLRNNGAIPVLFIFGAATAIGGIIALILSKKAPSK